MEFINYYADFSDSDNNSESENKEDQDFIDDTEIENYPSDYYGLLHVTRTFSEDENDVHSETDLEAFRNEDTLGCLIQGGGGGGAGSEHFTIYN